MPLREDFEYAGNWLFRRRSYLPFLLAALALAGMSHFDCPSDDHRLYESWEGACLAIVFGGLVIRALVVGFTPPGTSGRNTAEG